MKDATYKKLLLVIVLVVFIWSGIRPHDYMTWLMEVVPAILGAIAMWFTRKRFPLSNFMLTCIAIHAIILMIGGHYTYAQVPIGNWLRDIGIFGRNNYDKLGHFVQGFFPIIYAREILLRNKVLNIPGNSIAEVLKNFSLTRGMRIWLGFICISVVGLITALYEIIEWLSAVALGDRATDFLGTQGYIYDTQSDMFLALVGGLIAIVLLSRTHDRSMQKVLDAQRR